MTDPDEEGRPVHQPRTVRPGGDGPTVVVRPRTIGALGRPDPMPPIEVGSRVAPGAFEPPTGPVAVAYDPELWILDERADDATDDDHGDPVTTTAEVEVTDAGSGPEADPAAVAAQPRTLLRNNVLVASGTLVSRITGLVRTALIASLLAKSLADTYLLANVTPNIIYELVLGGILTATLVPLFTEDLERGDGEATSAVVSVTIVALAVLAVVTAVLSPQLIHLYSTGSGQTVRGDFREVGTKLAILFAPQVFFYGLMALWSAVLNTRHRFFAAAWAPVLNNLVVIGVLVATWRHVGHAPGLGDLLDDDAMVLLLGLGTTAGIVVMALSLYPAIRRSGARLRFRFRPRHPAVRRAMGLSLWTLGYVLANQVALAVVNILAKPGSGGVRDYTVSFQVFQLPHSLLAVSIMVTMEPLLGRATARHDGATFNRQYLLGFRLIAMLVIPAAVAYLALPLGLRHGIEPTDGLVAEVLHYGPIVAAFAVGLPGFSSYLYAFRGFYAMKDTRTPFFINCFECALNVVTAIVFVRWWDVVGLALSFSLAYTVSALVAVAVVSRRSPGFDLRGLMGSWAKLLVAGAAMGGFVYGVTAVIAPTTNALLVATLLVAGVLGAVTYFGAIYALDVPGIADLTERLPGRRRRKPVA